MTPSTGYRGRAEYTRMAAAFDGLARIFDADVPDDVLTDLALFARTMEQVDRELDEMERAEDRAELSQVLLDTLDPLDAGARHRVEGRAPPTTCLDDIVALRGSLQRRGTLLAFREALGREFRTTESLRSLRCDHAFIEGVEDEGRLAVAMTLAILGPHANAGLEQFLWSIAEIGNLVDKLLDVRGDFARGEIVIAPDVRLHARLFRALIEHLPAAFRSHPRPSSLARWGLSLVAPMIVRRRGECSKARLSGVYTRRAT